MGHPMSDNKYLTVEEVVERYRGAVTVSTLESWRGMRIGPAFIKVGKAVLLLLPTVDEPRTRPQQ